LGIWNFGAFGGVDRSLWIGLTDQAQEGHFVWTSGEPLTYTNWIPGQPDNFGGGENWVHMMRGNNGFVPGEWNDLNSPNVFFASFEPIQGVVEVPEPSTLVLAAFSGCALAVLSRRRG
jgi:lectin-like protein/PEP-CTERM motif-containing protein